MSRIKRRSRSGFTVRGTNFIKDFLSDTADWLTFNLGLEQRLSLSVLLKIMWVCFLVVVYIYFQHNYDKLVRKTADAEEAVDKKRAEYIYHKSKYLYSSKQSEIEKKLGDKGFSNQHPPIKITIEP